MDLEELLAKSIPEEVKGVIFEMALIAATIKRKMENAEHLDERAVVRYNELREKLVTMAKSE